MPILLLLTFTLLQRPPEENVVDLRGRLLEYDSGQYVLLDAMGAPGGGAVFFRLDPSRFQPKSTLFVAYNDPVFIFVNGTYAGTSGRVMKLDLDSLLSSWSMRPPGEFMICVRPVTRPGELIARVESGIAPHTAEAPFAKRNEDFFGNLVILGLLLILALLAAARQLNEKLLRAYFSIRQLMLRRDLEEMQQMNEVRGSSNLLFYVIAALMVSFVVLLTFTFSLSSAGRPLLRAESFVEAIGAWGKLAVFVFIFFLVKWALTVFMSWLFHVSEIVRAYYFNWMRILLLIASSLLVVALTYYAGTEKNSMIVDYDAGLFLMALVWIVVLFHKLRWRMNFSLFHLISYICTIELVPLLILSEVF